MDSRKTMMTIACRTLVAFAVAMVALAGCSSSDKSADSPTKIFCSAEIAGSPVCYGYDNLNADQQKAVSDACTQSLQGKLVSSCPSDNKVGCCATKDAYSTTTCYYNGQADTFSAACKQSNGTWTAGK